MAQSLSKIYIHLVFSTKNRTDTIPKKRITEVFAYIASILKEHKCPAICVGGTTNHIHILFVLDRNNALTEIVRTVKSCTTRWINESSPVTEHFCWQDGYCDGTALQMRRKKLVAQRRRRERVYKRTAAASVTFCGKGGAAA